MAAVHQTQSGAERGGGRKRQGFDSYWHHGIQPGGNILQDIDTHKKNEQVGESVYGIERKKTSVEWIHPFYRLFLSDQLKSSIPQYYANASFSLLLILLRYTNTKTIGWDSSVFSVKKRLSFMRCINIYFILLAQFTIFRWEKYSTSIISAVANTLRLKFPLFCFPEPRIFQGQDEGCQWLEYRFSPEKNEL